MRYKVLDLFLSNFKIRFVAVWRNLLGVEQFCLFLWTSPRLGRSKFFSINKNEEWNGQEMDENSYWRFVWMQTCKLDQRYFSVKPVVLAWTSVIKHSTSSRYSTTITQLNMMASRVNLVVQNCSWFSLRWNLMWSRITLSVH